MSSVNAEYKSRWGYHPCSYELFLKLKTLHKFYWRTLYDFHRWHRWWRKQEQNRFGPEPKFCSSFVKDEIWYKPVRFHGEHGFKVYPKTVVDHEILELYRMARIASSVRVTPFDDERRRKIESLYEEVTTYFK